MEVGGISFSDIAVKQFKNLRSRNASAACGVFAGTDASSGITNDFNTENSKNSAVLNITSACS